MPVKPIDVSIIIPSYNRSLLLKETLESVIEQDFENWECIVVDDGSEEDNVSLVKKFQEKDSRFVILKRPENKPKGANSCRNYGLSITRSTFVCWLDSDDIMLSNHISTHLKEHRKERLVATVSNALSFHITRDNILQSWATITPMYDALEDMILGRISWQTASPVWRSESLSDNPFDERLQSSQEWLFHISMLMENINFKIVDMDTILIRRHDNRIGTQKTPEKLWSNFESRLIVFKKLHRNNKLTKTLDYKLIRDMHNPLKKAIRNKYIKTYIELLKSLCCILPKTRYRILVLKTLMFKAPVYIIFGKGETLFNIKKKLP
jgi:glycosyltransferase involved in cell wall biosynthesis